MSHSRSTVELPFETEEEAQTLVANVLVVDDEDTVRQVFERMLSRESDLRVETVPSAEVAVQLLSTQRYELLITDKNLPGLNGVELIEKAKALRPAIDAIMITGYANAESVIAAFAAGASDYLVKPFDDIRTVKAKIRAALDRRKARRVSTEQAQQIAHDAAQLLSGGKNVAEAVWNALDAQLKEYEALARGEGKGRVVVVGVEAAAQQLVADGIKAVTAEPNDLRLDVADVVVIDTRRQDWRFIAEQLIAKQRDVVLAAGEEENLSDLLDAITLKLELVSLRREGLLTSRVRALLARQAISRAKGSLAESLARFRDALSP